MSMWSELEPGVVERERARKRAYAARPDVAARKVERRREARRRERLERLLRGDEPGEFRNQAHRNIEPPPEVWAERDRAIAAGYSSLVAMLAGDPLPGRSAYDREQRA